jgi:hypothetical protein
MIDSSRINRQSRLLTATKSGARNDASTQAIDNDCHRRLAGAVSDLGFARMETLEPITLHPLGMMLSHARARVASMYGSAGSVLVVD